jgi:hypothetical protein
MIITLCGCVSSSATQSDYHQCDLCPDTIFIILPLFIKYRQDM